MEIRFEKDQKNINSPSKNKGLEIIEKIKKIKLPNTFYYFVLLFAISFGFYMMMLVDNNMTLAYGGDYSAQYIPMGYHVWDYYHDWFRSGHFTLFDQQLYLGANSFGSNAYYGLFSPFNLIIIIFPRSFVPHALALCSMIKLSCAGLFFSFYMHKSFKVKQSVARICGVAYAFAGWGAFYLWYNNYQDILVFFPLVLFGIEKILQENKPCLLALGVFLLAICNYVLMVPYIICAFFYALFRFFQRISLNKASVNFKILGLGVLGCLAGMLMSLFVFMPAFMATISSPKLDSSSYLGMLKQYLSDKNYQQFIQLLFSWDKAPDQHNRIFPTRIAYPILEFFFPATTCRSLPTLELYGWDFDDMAVSLWCYVPFIMFLVPALIQSGKEKKFSAYIGFALLLVSLFTPVMYYLTMGFSNGYARWTLFIVTSLIAYVGIYIDKIPHVAKWHNHLGYAFAILGIVAAWIITIKLNTKEDPSHGNLVYRFVDGTDNFTNVAFIIELIYVTIVYLVLLFLFNKKAFHTLLMGFVAIEAMCMGNFVTIGHGYDTNYNNGYAYNERFRKLVTSLEKRDPTFYRLYSPLADAYSSNNSFINGYSTVSFFHSLYNFEINDFTIWTGLRNGKASVSGEYRGKYQDLDNLLGVKYYVTSKNKNLYYGIEEAFPNNFMDNVPFDFTKIEQLENDEFLVYENNLLNDFGNSYDTIYNYPLSNSNRFSVDVVNNAATLSSVAIVDEEDGVEIANAHSDIDLLDEEPTNHSISQLYLTSDYKQDFYDLKSTGLPAKYYPLKDIPLIPSTYPASSYVPANTMDYFVFYTSPIDGQPLFKANTTLYAQAAFSGSKKYDFYFIDKNNQIFMFDAHDDNTTDNVSAMRGFYLKKDVYKMAVVGKYYQSYVDSVTIKLFTESLYDYQYRRDKLKADPLEEVTYAPDKFTFKTHYENDKFVVSRVAYDKGWKISAIDLSANKEVDVKLYKGNGGFVSFVAPKGDIAYTLYYETPYLQLSYLISGISVTSFLASLCGYYLYCENKKVVYLDKIYREN